METPSYVLKFAYYVRPRTIPSPPLIEGDAPLPTDVDAWAAFHAFLPIYRYRDIAHLIAALDEAVITPVEQYVRPRPIVERPSS